jgi:beta-mannanase
MNDIPELNPQEGGSYVRDPETGELHPVQPEQPTEE